MAVNFRKLFGIESLSSYVLSSMTKTNLDIVGYESCFIAALSGVIVLSTFLPMPPWSDKAADVVACYRIGFIAMALACIITWAAVTRVKKMSNRSVIAPLVMLLFIVAVMGISMWLTLFDFEANRSLLIYIAALVLLFGVIYLPPVVTFVVVLICTLIMIAELSIRGYSGFVYSRRCSCTRSSR